LPELNAARATANAAAFPARVSHSTFV